jgi:hypothetical protein
MREPKLVGVGADYYQIDHVQQQKNGFISVT